MALDITADQAIEAISFNVGKTAVVSKAHAYDGYWGTYHWKPGLLSMGRNNNFFTSLSKKGSHSKAEAEQTFALVFDDPVEFDDPSKGTPLQDLIASIPDSPKRLSYVLQTSPKKYQAGLLLQHNGLLPNEINKLMAAIQAMLPDGSIDKGPGSRMARLPGINDKPDHVKANGGLPFESRYTEWRPTNRFAIGSLLKLVGLSQADIVEAASADSNLERDDDNPIFQSDLIEVIGDHPDGYLIHCPWRTEHTTKDTPALLTISDERVIGFKCFHAHCNDRKGKDLLALLETHDRGIIKIIKDYRMEAQVSTIEQAREEISRMSSKERLEKQNYLITKYNEVTLLRADYVFVATMNRFLYLPTGACFTKEAFNQKNGHLAKVASDLLKGYPDCQAEAATTHFGKGRLYTQDHQKSVNLFNPHVLRRGSPGDATPFVNHMYHLYNDHALFVMKTMAFSMKFPAVKINWLTILGGNKGVGKDAILVPIRHYFGRYHKTIETNLLMDSFNSYLDGTKLLVLNELSASRQREGSDLHNEVKRILASPPETITINRKGVPTYEVPNLVTVFATTNNPNALPIERDARRFFMVFSDVPATPENIEKAQELYRWYDKGGLKIAINLLENLDTSGFDPKSNPPATEWQGDTAESSKSNLQHAIDEVAEQMDDGEYIVAPLLSITEIRDLLLEWRDATRNESVHIPSVNKLSTELKRLQYTSVSHNGNYSDAPRKLWVIRDIDAIKQLSKQDQLKLYRPPPTGENIM